MLQFTRIATKYNVVTASHKMHSLEVGMIYEYLNQIE